MRPQRWTEWRLGWNSCSCRWPCIPTVIYFVPTIIAVLKRKRNWLAIFLVNLFFGWTVIGWILALIWSVMHEERR